ncbi:MAG: hypothetical protein GXP62_20665, partial [Oligoflexia bacterium]|nr:hypothetical protein [Oligoflexia bacterium]
QTRHPRVFAAIASLSLLLLGPFVATGTCDFRPSVLFLPGILGAFAAARVHNTKAALLWGLVALSGRQEASYLLVAAGAALCVLPWSDAPPAHSSGWRRFSAAIQWKVGLSLLTLGLVSFALWVLVKPAFFFHFDPRHLAPAAHLEPGHLAARVDFVERALRSGLVLGLLSPTGLLAGLPLGIQMARDGREWTDLVGATAHYHAPWLAFALASAMVGVSRWPRRLGGAWVGLLLFVLGNALAWPLPAPRSGPVALRSLVARVPPDAAVAADYDTIHAVAGRAVLWNTAQLYMPEDQRPYGWTRPWPITLDGLDAVLTTTDDPVLDHAKGWKEDARVDVDGRSHVLLLRPAAPTEPGTPEPGTQ